VKLPVLPHGASRPSRTSLVKASESLLLTLFSKRSSVHENGGGVCKRNVKGPPFSSPPLGGEGVEWQTIKCVRIRIRRISSTGRPAAVDSGGRPWSRLPANAPPDSVLRCSPAHSPAQGHGCLRRISLTALSRPSRKRDRSRLPNGGGPPLTSPSSRSSESKFRVASAGPILSSVKALPAGPST